MTKRSLPLVLKETQFGHYGGRIFRLSYEKQFWTQYWQSIDTNIVYQKLPFSNIEIKNVSLKHLNSSAKGNAILPYTAQKMKFSIKDFFSKCDQIRSSLRIWSHLPKKSLMENFIFCAVIMEAGSINYNGRCRSISVVCYGAIWATFKPKLRKKNTPKKKLLYFKKWNFLAPKKLNKKIFIEKLDSWGKFIIYRLLKYSKHISKTAPSKIHFQNFFL